MWSELRLGASHDDDVDEVLEALEARAVAGVQRQTRGTGGGGDEQVHGAGAVGLAAGGGDRCVDATVGTGRFAVERERVECGLGSL